VGIYLSRFERPARDARPAEDITYLRFAYCGQVDEAVIGAQLDHGIVRTLWMTPEEVRASAALHRSPLVLQCIEDHQRGQRYPMDLVYTDPSVQSGGHIAQG
jgi:hypothetical protein